MEISAADMVALRFPPEWSDDITASAQADAPQAQPQTYALASASEHQLDTGLLFSPFQTYSATNALAPAGQSTAETTTASLSVQPVTPEGQSQAKPEPKAETKSETKSATKSEQKAAPTRALAAAPARRAAPRKDSGVLFNDAQLASIRTRLKLSSYQEQYWPPVEAALRAIGQRAARNIDHRITAYVGDTRLADIDSDGPEVQQLKSAAFPLIMSMSEEQKQQVRTIAHVMGLERVASSF